MILVGSQRGGARQLAAHLLNDRDNDHVTLHELRGFMADDLQGAVDEIRAVAKGTRCTQVLFSLSLSPPKDAAAGIDDLVDAADRAEQALGLAGQPRALVIHEKNGRRHAHAVWSRIDAAEMKAVNLPFFKTRLNELSRELYLEHGWELPDGHKTNGWKNPLNFTLAEWQQAKRISLDPREIKQLFQEAWQQSDNLPSFKNALEDRGYFLAKGDRRGFVALDIHGEVFAVARWAGIKIKDVRARLGEPDCLPDVDARRDETRKRLNATLRSHLAKDKHAKQAEVGSLLRAKQAIVVAQRNERLRLDKGLRDRHQRETKERAGRFKRGLGAVMDFLTGKTAATKRANEAEAYRSFVRDKAQREALFGAQMKERQALQQCLDQTCARHSQERMRLTRQITHVLKAPIRYEQEAQRSNHLRGFEMDH
ncbi:relaxase/mobilization nuclease domain-containing protein [uncultured Bradyrhizobium sp.]|uniref:relaxase/mobilization nuclease domain-containing protein n=1 Tax=uncultured Bradyrhizobium sp. TaxID=199684 RepID=UPI0035CC875F